MRPRLLRSGLTGQVYVVTRYTDHAPKDGKPGYTIAHTKYDVTEEFNALVETLRETGDGADPQDGDTCSCGAEYHEGAWWDAFLAAAHGHRPEPSRNATEPTASGREPLDGGNQ